MFYFCQLSRLGFWNTSSRRRALQARSNPSCETLEVRQMLSAVAVNIATDTDVESPITPVHARDIAELGRPARNAHPREGETFVKPWQGTWTVFTDVPFMDGGTITINQTSTAPSGTTAIVTGLSGATVRKVKAVGDQVLAVQFIVFNSISERTVKVTAAFVHGPTLLNFQGNAKVQGGSAHEHTFWGQRVSGPDTAMVDLQARATDSDVRNNGRVIPGTAAFRLTNLGDAGVPQGGSQFLIVFDDQAGVPGQAVQLGRIWYIGFASVQPTVVDGHTALICVSNQWLNPARKSGSAGIVVQVIPPGAGGIAVTGKLTDVPGHPAIQEEQAIVTVH